MKSKYKFIVGASMRQILRCWKIVRHTQVIKMRSLTKILKVLFNLNVEAKALSQDIYYLRNKNDLTNMDNQRLDEIVQLIYKSHS